MKNIFLPFFFLCVLSLSAFGQSDTIHTDVPGFSELGEKAELLPGAGATFFEKAKGHPFVDSVTVLGKGKDTLWIVPQWHKKIYMSSKESVEVLVFQTKLQVVLRDLFPGGDIFLENHLVKDGGVLSSEEVSETNPLLSDNNNVFIGVEGPALTVWASHKACLSLIEHTHRIFLQKNKNSYDYFCFLEEKTKTIEVFHDWFLSSIKGVRKGSLISKNDMQTTFAYTKKTTEQLRAAMVSGKLQKDESIMDAFYYNNRRFSAYYYHDIRNQEMVVNLINHMKNGDVFVVGALHIDSSRVEKGQYNVYNLLKRKNLIDSLLLKLRPSKLVLVVVHL